MERDDFTTIVAVGAIGALIYLLWPRQGDVGEPVSRNTPTAQTQQIDECYSPPRPFTYRFSYEPRDQRLLNLNGFLTTPEGERKVVYGDEDSIARAIRSHMARNNYCSTDITVNIQTPRSNHGELLTDEAKSLIRDALQSKVGTEKQRVIVNWL